MNQIDFLHQRFDEFADRPALGCDRGPVSYGELAELIANARQRLDAAGIGAGAVVALVGDFSPTAIAYELAVVERAATLVPIARAAASQLEQRCATATAEWVVWIDESEHVEIARTRERPEHPLLLDLQHAGRPGLVVFSSGSSGTPKAALHDLSALLATFRSPRRPLRMVAFLLFDHLGGISTQLRALSSGGLLVLLDHRSPDVVCGAVEHYRAELLPVSPTFLNLVLLARVWERYDLSSLKLVTYGTEPIAEQTLATFHRAMPDVELRQTYGLSETGVVQSRSRAPDSVWMRLGGTGCKVRVRDGMLEVRTSSAMLGYLNAPSPFTDDGWLRTGDAVETDGDWVRVVGRNSELINIGGQKVYPTEIEGVLEEMDGVEEAVVFGEASPILGQLVCAHVSLSRNETTGAFRRRMRAYCRDRLERYKIPQRVVVVSDQPLHSRRYKKERMALAH